MPIAIMIKKRNMLRMFLIGIKIGFVGISSCSFKKAIKLPVNVIVPIMILINIVVTEYVENLLMFNIITNSCDEIKAEANPPNPLKRATI